ncbi:xanthine dehydrogenase FAD-binding subunit [Marinitoga hydrogenitolerans DSM 16785]|uniref:Xanthine dehydrogenase FAD-binding subunit n=1 Tax=Marinitoga hydrogenitolerans (strain DSM 16785 / JCM 12826 / AT1271) TaxID=1122195 RepID=A0A1M4T3F2_MARH1|nr:FAD binding domain-containing protein [Marinitoga hydrogenitolerans]SHE38934.1 xanthine dehydrogenase FAD-binding subunit [Marinitoga hydrogenitolerans DSM 16785]
MKYFKPKSIEEISNLKSKFESVKLLSGGTDLMVKMRAGVLNPQIIIDTKGLEKEKIEFVKEKVKIPINTTYDDLLNNKEFQEKYQMIVDIIKQIGSPQIRNRATPIGNVANASPAGDFLLATYLFRGYAEIKPSNKKIKISHLIHGPGKLSLKPEEFIYAIELRERKGYRYYYEKVGKRNAMNISIISIGMLLKVKDNIIEDIKVAYGSVGPTVMRFKDLEKEMIGKEFSEKVFEEFSDKYMERINPITDVRASAEYRKKMVKNLFIKAFYNI